MTGFGLSIYAWITIDMVHQCVHVCVLMLHWRCKSTDNYMCASN